MPPPLVVACQPGPTSLAVPIALDVVMAPQNETATGERMASASSTLIIYATPVSNRTPTVVSAIGRGRPARVAATVSALLEDIVFLAQAAQVQIGRECHDQHDDAERTRELEICVSRDLEKDINGQQIELLGDDQRDAERPHGDCEGQRDGRDDRREQQGDENIPEPLPQSRAKTASGRVEVEVELPNGRF